MTARAVDNFHFSSQQSSLKRIAMPAEIFAISYHLRLHMHVYWNGDGNGNGNRNFRDVRVVGGGGGWFRSSVYIRYACSVLYLHNFMLLCLFHRWGLVKYWLVSHVFYFFFYRLPFFRSRTKVWYGSSTGDTGKMNGDAIDMLV